MTSILLNKVLAAELGDEAWFEGILRWVLEGAQRVRRLGELERLLAAHPRGPEWRARIRAVWNHTSAVGLLADAGLPAHAAFFREALELLVDRCVPSLDADNDLSALLHRLDLDERDADWIAALPEGGGPWRELLAVPAEVRWDAVELLALRAAALALSRDLLELGPAERAMASPFAYLPAAAASLRAGGEPGWEGLLQACRQRLRQSLAHLERHGTSSELVYRLDLLAAHLDRLGALVDLHRGRLDPLAFAADLVRCKARARRLGTLLAGSTRIMARKVVEHTGQTGEHYIAGTRAEWAGTFRSAAGGGALTAFTAAAKYALGAAALAPLMAGLGFTLNYAASFIAMQFAGFTLASKQPAMTAASLAGALEDGHAGAALEDLVAGITRSQVMATAGNVLATLPATLVLGLCWRWLAGVPFVDPATARHSLHGLHPFRSWTIPFALLTGVLLWLSSLVAGWAANWSAYRRLPEALARHRRLLALLGPDRTRSLAAQVERHFSGVAGYLALGFLLGFLPVAGAFAGLPVEVRHVTLNAASLALCAVQDAPPWADIAWGLAGIAVIGLCNFSVSFYLALGTAMRARGLGPRERLLPGLWRAFRRDPWKFLGPPQKE